MTRLDPIQPEAVALVWREIRKDVLKCLESSTDGCLPEDVYYFLRTGMASLYIVRTHDEDYEGFCVLQRVCNMHTGRPQMFIWLAYCKHRENTVAAYELIEEYAREMDCERVFLKNPKSHFIKIMAPMGFHQDQIDFVKPL